MEERATSLSEREEATEGETQGPECGNHLACDEGFACLRGKCVEEAEVERHLLEAEQDAIQRAREAEARARAKAEAANQETGTNDP